MEAEIEVGKAERRKAQRWYELSLILTFLGCGFYVGCATMRQFNGSATVEGWALFGMIGATVVAIGIWLVKVRGRLGE
jgi:hypothetical protein